MLTTEDHRRDRLGLTYVYPVLSRRAGGVSIGINLNINNACNWACIYCQVEGLKRGGPPPVDLSLLDGEFKGFLTEIIDGDFLIRKVPPGFQRLADIAFSGNGEPTCAAEFPEAVMLVRDALAERNLLPQIPLRLITNGSQLHRPAVQRGVQILGESHGEIWFKLDRAGATQTRAVNGVALSTQTVLAHLRQACLHARTWIQTCWFGWDGRPPGASERSEYCHLVSEVSGQIAGIHLYGLARPSLQRGASRLTRLPQEELEEFAAEIREKTGIRVTTNP